MQKEFTQQHLNKTYELAERMTNVLNVLKCYCISYSCEETITSILPIVEYLWKDSGTLYALINNFVNDSED